MLDYKTTMEIYTSRDRPYKSTKVITTKSGETITATCIKVYAFNLSEKSIVMFDSVAFASFGLRVSQKLLNHKTFIVEPDGDFWICYKVKQPEDEKILQRWISDPETDVYTHLTNNLPQKKRKALLDIKREQEKHK